MQNDSARVPLPLIRASSGRDESSAKTQSYFRWKWPSYGSGAGAKQYSGAGSAHVKVVYRRGRRGYHVPHLSGAKWRPRGAITPFELMDIVDLPHHGNTPNRGDQVES